MSNEKENERERILASGEIAKEAILLSERGKTCLLSYIKEHPELPPEEIEHYLKMCDNWDEAREIAKKMLETVIRLTKGET